ncbi:unnamed protein product [Caenorhabditis sp. 36 PRJEB53466]|nr:unnamed protein product [Caenorhabditis sp. 36 PRJEB53466]
MDRLPFTPSYSKNTIQNVDAQASLYFLDGKASPQSLLELDNNRDMNENTTPSNNSMLDESILASSKHNSTMDLPISAPSSIARDRVLASSTPKDQGGKKLPTLPYPEMSVRREPVPTYECADRRLRFRSQRMRNQSDSYPHPRERSTRSTEEPVRPAKRLFDPFSKENIKLLEEQRAAELALEERWKMESEDRNRARNVAFIKNLTELLFSLFMPIYQLFVLQEVIPDHAFFFYLTQTLNTFYVIAFLRTSKLFWKISISSLILVAGTQWLLGWSFDVFTFFDTTIVARSLLLVLRRVCMYFL